MAGRRAVLVLGSAALVVVGTTLLAVWRFVTPRGDPAWQPPPASGPVPPPPLGGGLPPASSTATPRVLRVDSTGCAPVEERGFTAAMTLDSVARSDGIPVEIVIRGLGLPADVSRTTPLGTLMREHRFSLQDVRRIVQDYLKHCE